LDKYPIQLSGGQRQRAALARTLLVEPELVIFDESLSALDVFNQQKMISLIIALQESRQFTGIFIAHDRALVNALCHEIIVIDQGEIVQ
jgi:ABC-type glutathione transport system ATPase component